jgi:hypothetical protein
MVHCFVNVSVSPSSSLFMKLFMQPQTYRLTFGRIHDDIEKEDAFRGLCAMVCICSQNGFSVELDPWLKLMFGCFIHFRSEQILLEL